jgi:hypothetical protein
MFKPLLLFTVLSTVPVAALAQLHVQEPPVGYSGSLIEFSADRVTLRDKDGKVVEVAMTPSWTISSVRSLDAGAIKPGSFVATANTVVDDHSGRSTELRIFEPGYRPEEGTHLMAQQSNTAMTHGTVASVTRGTEGVELEVTYPGGSRHIIVPPDVKITGYDLQDRKVLKPGVRVSAVARKGPDGVLRAGRLVLSQPN